MAEIITLHILPLYQVYVKNTSFCRLFCQNKKESHSRFKAISIREGE